MEPIIVASHLGKTYRSGKLEVPALRDATFSIDPGEFVAIVGPSGSGKSTLFYVLGGLTSATSGSLFIQGQDFSRLNDAQRTSLRRSQIGFVFQRFNLLPTISAAANIELAHDIAATGKPFDKELLDHLSGLLKIRMNFPAASSSAWRLPALSLLVRRFCWRMSRPAISTRRTRTLCWRCCRLQVAS
jgi:putative ABC transport system ATP-binding protein